MDTEAQSSLADALARAKKIGNRLSRDSPEEAVACGPITWEEKKMPIGPEEIKMPMMVVEKMKMPTKLIEMVIGRDGEMVKKIQSDTKAIVRPPPPIQLDAVPPLEQEISIMGTAEAVSKAKTVLMQIMEEGNVPDIKELLKSSPSESEYVLNLKIPAGKVGLIIGKRGETIRSLQEKAKCRMVLIQDGEFQDRDEKSLRITGEKKAVLYGKRLAEDLIEAKELVKLNIF